MGETPGFLTLPARSTKPRSRGITHALDKGLPLAVLESQLAGTASCLDIAKIGWGIGYVDRTLADRVALYHDAGVLVSLGGTLTEVATAQDRVDELRRWALSLGIDAIEVSNGLGALTPDRKCALVKELSQDLLVVAEAGSKDAGVPVSATDWSDEMQSDLDAGARWVIAEGRESGTVGLYEPDGSVRASLVEHLLATLPSDVIIFETPMKAQQVWFVERLGSEVNLGNIAPDDVLPLETLRLGLRADTAHLTTTL